MSEDSSGKTVKVVDRRWFTAEGDLRDVPEEPTAGVLQPEPKAVTQPAEPKPAPETSPRGESPASAPGTPSAFAHELGVVDLIDALAQPAAALLSGQLPGRGRDLEGARYYIDLLGVIRSRMGTPLNAEETRYLDDVLYQLRSLFVAATR